jgi:hypothetical protein
MEATGDIELVARWLGHDDIEQSSIYIEPNIKALRAALCTFLDGVDET